MAKKIQHPVEQFAVYENDGTEPYLVFNNSIEQVLEYRSTGSGEVVEILVYKLDKVIKVKRESAYKIVG